MTQILGKVSLFSLVLLLLLVSVGWASDQQVSQADLEQLFKQLESEHFGTSLQAQNELVALGDQSVPGLENILSRFIQSMESSEGCKCFRSDWFGRFH